jgi:hypothetical protein
MSPFEGSSRRSRFTRMHSSWAVNHPFLPRNQEAVWQGLGGMMNHDNIPTQIVTHPSTRNLLRVRTLMSEGIGMDIYSHCHPDHPRIPRIWRSPAAANESRMLLALKKSASLEAAPGCDPYLRAVQKMDNRTGSSLDFCTTLACK